MAARIVASIAFIAAGMTGAELVLELIGTAGCVLGGIIAVCFLMGPTTKD